MSYEAAQEQLQNALVTTFLANLSFLNEYDNELYQRVDALSQVINSGLYEENYTLEFLENIGEFDIFDKKNNRYLYDKKPNKFVNNAVNRTDFTSKGSVSVIENKLFEMKKFKVFEEEEYFCDFEYSNKKLGNETLEFTKILQNNLGDFKFKQFKQFHKFVFMGTLLGRHIPPLMEKINARNYFVCERNLEIFRLSLFVVDYSNLARDGKHVFFSIMDDPAHFNEKLENFFSHESYQNYCIKYFSTDFGVQDYFEGFTNKALAHNNSIFNYLMMLENVFKYTTQRLNNYSILKLLKQTNNKLLEKPVLFLAAGPSLNENIQWVKENQDKFLIVAIGATYKILFKHNIKPAVVTTMDPQYSVLNKKHFAKKDVELLKDTFVIASINTDKRILDRFNQNKLFLYETVRPILFDNRCYAGFSVGELTLAIMLSLGFKNCYMLGLDLAFNQKTGETHTRGYSNKSYDLESKGEEFSLRDGVVVVKGNKDKEVFTNRLFSLSIEAMNININSAKKENQNIYNLSNHGAYFHNTIPLNIEDIDLEALHNEEVLESDLSDFLKEVSSSSLNENEKARVDMELNFLLDFKEYLTLVNENSATSFDDFDEKVKHIYLKLFYENSNLTFVIPVFIKFFNVFLQYIYYCFNTKKFKKEKENIASIEKLFFEKLVKVLDKYISYLKNI